MQWMISWMATGERGSGAMMRLMIAESVDVESVENNGDGAR